MGRADVESIVQVQNLALSYGQPPYQGTSIIEDASFFIQQGIYRRRR